MIHLKHKSTKALEANREEYASKIQSIWTIYLLNNAQSGLHGKKWLDQDDSVPQAISHS
jgi:hypothetical protein